MFREHQTIIDRIFKQEIIYNIPLFEIILLVFIAFFIICIIIDIIEELIIKMEKK